MKYYKFIDFLHIYLISKFPSTIYLATYIWWPYEVRGVVSFACQSLFLHV